MRLNITAVNRDSGPDADGKHLVLCLDNIEDVVQSIGFRQIDRSLRLKLDFTFGSGNKLDLTSQMQQTFLLPFFKLDSVGQEYTINGHVDADLAVHTHSIMTPHLHGKRART